VHLNSGFGEEHEGRPLPYGGVQTLPHYLPLDKRKRQYSLFFFRFFQKAAQDLPNLAVAADGSDHEPIAQFVLGCFTRI
jgi:hypothetical protein